jgi:hypothetical protein
MAAAEVVVGIHTTWDGRRSMEQDKERDEVDRERGDLPKRTSPRQVEEKGRECGDERKRRGNENLERKGNPERPTVFGQTSIHDWWRLNQEGMYLGTWTGRYLA